MTPTPEQIVAACQRAGIHYIESIDNYLGLYDNDGSFRYIVASDDQTGSALFIVAVLQVLDKSDGEFNLWHNIDKWTIDLSKHDVPVGGGMMPKQVNGDTLTAACMAAIVAAYPGEVAP